MHAIEIDHLTYSYPGAAHPALQDITVCVEQGDFLAIVGNNGCGKSTFCQALNGLIPQFISGDFSGRVLACGLDTRTSDVGALARKVGYVYQDFENQIIRPTVLDDASYACQNYAMPDYKERGMMALERCGLRGRESDFIWQLSGGQTHLLALAGALSLQPDVLILDEPIAQLDPAHADRIYGVLRELNERYGKTIIVIEHHTEYIADFCKHVMLLKDGRVEWMLPTGEALQRVEELQNCNIFPPQVTLAAWRMRQAGSLTVPRLPATISEGREVFVPRADPAPAPRPAVPAQGEPVSLPVHGGRRQHHRLHPPVEPFGRLPVDHGHLGQRPAPVRGPVVLAVPEGDDGHHPDTVGDLAGELPPAVRQPDPAGPQPHVLGLEDYPLPPVPSAFVQILPVGTHDHDVVPYA